MAEELSARAKKVLTAVIANYVTTAEPVGSRTVSKQAKIGVSPATVRNVMADLEDMGYLSQPHTSAGRVPTVEGLKFYVNSILQVRELDQHAKDLLRQTVAEPGLQEMSDLLKAVSRGLSSISQQVAVVAAPPLDKEVFRQIEFIRLRPGLILVVLVSRSAVVQNRVIEAEESLGQEELDKYARYLNELLLDLTLTQVKQRLAEEMALDKARFNDLISRALNLGRLALEGEGDADVYIEGQSNLLDAPEFADVARLRKVFIAFEEKSIVLRLLEKAQMAHGVHIFIGSEAQELGLDDLTLVTSAYGAEARALGALGIIGPTRMDYSRVIPVVDYTARLVSEILGSRM